MATIELRQVEKKFGDLHAVKPMDLTIYDGEFVVLLGPSGCGKTTTLRMIAGLETVTGGQILLNGRDVTWEHPSRRDIAFVFQLFALYPHMSVWQNIAFPLQAQEVPRREVRERVAQVARILEIEHLLRQRPRGLSMGDQQRVALARALVRQPAAFLMDEPLGALDAELRERMRGEIKRLHIEQHATTIYVTHDQVEAMAMGDRVVVMSDAVVQQVGTPAEVYYDPANLFVARFIGSPGMNLVPCLYRGGAVEVPGSGLVPLLPGWDTALERALGASCDLILGFRPEAARVTPEGPLNATVYASEMEGGYAMIHLTLGDEGGPIVHIRAGRDSRYPIGTSLRIALDPEMIRFFDPRTERAIPREVSR